MMPNGKQITSYHMALLPNTGLPLEARCAHVFPGLKNKALLSIGAFCDYSYLEIIANKILLRIIKSTRKGIMTERGSKISKAILLLA